MWHACNPKSDDDLKQCAELGKSLSRMSQPTILIVLAESAEPLHGYVIVQKAAASPMYGGKKPDPAGIYRTLKKMEEQGFVTSEWDTPTSGSTKRLFSLTPGGPCGPAPAGSMPQPATWPPSRSLRGGRHRPR